MENAIQNTGLELLSPTILTILRSGWVIFIS